MGGLRLSSKCDCWSVDFGVVSRVNPDELQFRVLIELSGLLSLGQAMTDNPTPALEDLDFDDLGFWRPGWDAELTIAGTRFLLDGGDTIVETNSVTGDYTVDARITPFSSLTAPTGESFGIANSAQTNTLTFSLDVSESAGQFTEASLDFNSASDPDMRMTALSPTPVNVTNGVGAISLGVPDGGEFIFRRSITPDQPDIVADLANTDGLVDFEVRAAGSFGSDAGQFTWDSLLANPQFDTEGLRGD